MTRRPRLLWPAYLAVLLLCLCRSAFADIAADFLQARLEPLLADGKALRLDKASAPRAVAEFYAARHWQPAWDATRYRLLLQALYELRDDGLNPDDYGFSRLQRWPEVTAPSQVADREIAATRGLLLALLHLYRGKVDPVQLDAHWNFDSRQIDPEQGLATVMQAVADNGIEPLFERARPAWAYYHLLQGALVQLRRIQDAGGWPEIPRGSPLKPGMSDARVPLLRKRLRLAGLSPAAEVAQPDLYDEALQAAVQRFQREANLDADGNVGPGTLAELNVPVTARIAQLRVNLERVRWFRNELKGDTVIVDIAGFRILFLHDGDVKWSSRVQVGREYRPSPVFQSAITAITLSPGWVVPPTIFREDSLPAIRRDPGYLGRNHLHVYNAAGQEIPAAAVDWNRPGNIQLRQEPAANGALGELVIRFPNPYAVYLHDTPHKELFDSSRRTTSSGCIRVQDVHELAVLLLDDPVHWNREALQRAIEERRTRNVPLPRKVPILLGYWTAQVDPDGYVAFRPDIYHRDAPVLQALGATL